jgi:hypothetical protein
MRNPAVVMVVLLSLLPSIVLADSSQAERIADLEREVKALRARVEALERTSNTAATPAASSIKPGNSKDIRNWRQLRQGMTEAEVERLLGAPGRVMESRALLMWEVGMGSVHFDPKTRRVEAWSEP